MIFQEKKEDTGYAYQCEDIFGVIELKTEAKLDAGILDRLVSFLLNQNVPAKETHGSVSTELGEVSYHFVKTDQWSEDTEEEPEVHPEPERRSIRKWCTRFVWAFREAWRNMK